MNLREIECFIAVADELHFGRAARRLHLAQPTVSESVRRLERQLGGALFDRSTRAVRLTELGKVFLDEARAAYVGIEAAYEKVRRIARCPDHAFTIGATAGDADLVVSATAAFARGLPAFNVQFDEMRTVEQIDAVLHRRIDVGVVWEPPQHPDLASLVLGRADYVAVVPHHHPLARRTLISLERLAGEPLITWSRASNPGLYGRFATLMEATGAPWSLVATASSATNMMARVISGQGIGVVPVTAMLGRRLHGTSLVRVGPNGPTAECALIWARRAPHVGVTMFAKTMQRAWTEYRSDHEHQSQLG